MPNRLLCTIRAQRELAAQRLPSKLAACILGAGALLSCLPGLALGPSDAALSDTHRGKDWAAFGRTYEEGHFSPLDEINKHSVSRLGLAWSYDLQSSGNSVTAPLEIDGVIYFASGLSVVHALDVLTGRLLWTHDPQVAAVAGHKLRKAWGSRGIAWWNGKIYTGTMDGRLIALDARTGKEVWSVLTVAKDNPVFISGPPRVFDGKVIVGNGGADFWEVRGYVTTYDAETGKQLWRFYTVPGNPANGFESDAMAKAAATWSGEWWKFGGGGTVWNAITYDAAQDLIFIGTGNGFPWNHRVRSAGTGDNLYLCSIVALDAKTGEYRWHYQINPGESWDYNAAMDMELADLVIDGRRRQVLMTAPKNGFFYVIDRITGKLISAEPFARVTWATSIDIKSGRPVEVPAARFPNGSTFAMWPGPIGAHSWLPMAYSPQTHLVYLPTIEMGVGFSDSGIQAKDWKHEGDAFGPAADLDFGIAAGDPLNGTSSLTAWNPVTQRAAWKLPTAGLWSGGALASAGGLVFQGQLDGQFNAYDASTGHMLWRFAAHSPVLAPAITFEVHGHQYVTVLTGMGTSVGMMGPLLQQFHIDSRTQAHRVLTFKLGGGASIPETVATSPQPSADPGYVQNSATESAGEVVYLQHCTQCHGVAVIAAGIAPDLRFSDVPLDPDVFQAVLHEGSLLPLGMPRFEELTDQQIADLRQYLRSRGKDVRPRETHEN
jgi:quinohemoprotein ethanol dehydrogenase